MYTYRVECLLDRLLSSRRRYTRFGIGPFEAGHANIVATNLRKGLLNGVPGWSANGASLKGVSHEFTTIPGVKESSLEIIINLRELVLTGAPPIKTNSEEIATLTETGPKVVTAKDLNLPKHIKVVDPNQEIATLGRNGSLEALVKLDYQTRNENFSLNQRSFSPQNISNFMSLGCTAFPVKRVSYIIRVEPHPVTKREVEYIFLEILSDNSLHPKRALIIATQHIIDLLWPIGGRRLRPHTNYI